MVKIQSLFRSRRFWAAAAGVIVTTFGPELGEAGLSPTVITDVVMLIAAWIVGDSLKSTE